MSVAPTANEIAKEIAYLQRNLGVDIAEETGGREGRRTEAYAVTITDPQAPEAGILIEMARLVIKCHNLSPRRQGPKLRLRVRGRLGPKNPRASEYRRPGQYSPIKLEHAAWADIYVHKMAE